MINSLQINSLTYIDSKKFVKEYEREKFGRMLHVSSIGVKYGGGENTFNYSLSKHLLEFSPSFIKKIKYNLLSNVLCVGFVKQKSIKKLKINLNKRINLIPIKRAAKINEITDMIFFLASEKNSYISMRLLLLQAGNENRGITKKSFKFC